MNWTIPKEIPVKDIEFYGRDKGIWYIVYDILVIIEISAASVKRKPG